MSTKMAMRPWCLCNEDYERNFCTLLNSIKRQLKTATKTGFFSLK